MEQKMQLKCARPLEQDVQPECVMQPEQEAQPECVMQPEQESWPEQNALLELNNLSVRYADGSDSVLQGISLSLHAAEIVCVIGESGSGKSTLFQSILQLQDRVMVTEGRVLFRGESLCESAARKLRRTNASGSADHFSAGKEACRTADRRLWNRRKRRFGTGGLCSIRGI